MLNKPKILITGASGFIGSFMVEKALAKGYIVWAGVRKSSSKEFLQDEHINFIDLDYSSKERLKSQLNGFHIEYGNIDYVIHCAGVTKSERKEDFDRVNYQYTKDLIDALDESSHSVENFLFLSSLSVMGRGDEINYNPFDITDIEKPNTAYGKSKLKAEQYIEKKSLPYIILRPTAVYGPRDRDFLLLLKTIQNGLAPTIGYKIQYPSFIYVEDLANAAFLALESDVRNKKYLLSDGNSYTDEEYIDLLISSLDKKNVIKLKVPLFVVKVAAWLGDVLAKVGGKGLTINSDKYKILTQKNWNCNILPVMAELGFHSQYDLKKGLTKTVKWYQDNRWL